MALDLQGEAPRLRRALAAHPRRSWGPRLGPLGRDRRLPLAAAHPREAAAVRRRRRRAGRAISDHPELRESVHAAATRFAGRSPRLVGSLLGMCRDLAGTLPDAEFQEMTQRALDLSRDVDLAATFMESAPSLLSRRDMDFLTGLARGRDRALAETEWWAARGFLQSVAKAGATGCTRTTCP